MPALTNTAGKDAVFKVRMTLEFLILIASSSSLC